MTLPIRQQARISAFLFLLLVLPSLAFANMAKPWMEGETVGEPLGTLKSLSIAKELLELDLRPLAKGDRAQVKATYTIENKGKPVTTSLLFVSFALNKGKVSLDGKTVSYTFVKDQPVPKDWKLPANQKPAMQKDPKKIHGMKFQVTIPAGQHTIEVQYPVSNGEFHPTDSMYRKRYVQYLLAPAKRWASFGTLDIKVTTPKRWQLKSNLKLTQSKQLWSGTFKGIPANHLLLNVKKRNSWFLQYRLPSILAVLFGILLTAGLLWSHAHSPSTMERSGMQRVGPFLGTLLLAAAVSLGLVLGSIWMENRLINLQQVSHTWAYGNQILRIMMLLVSGAGTLLLGTTAYLIGLRVKASKMSQEQI